jgi:hypothetical protein
MKSPSAAGAIVLAIAVLSGCGPGSSGDSSVRMVLGKAWIVRGGGKLEAKAGDVLRQGDSIETGAGSLVVADLNGGTAQVEVQENALFGLDSVEGADRTVSIRRGNLWLRVSKLIKGGSYRLKTPSSIAAVRGTKMYRFAAGDADGMCHCEGDVEYRAAGGSYGAVHHRDFMAFTKGGTTVLLSPEDLAFMMTPGTEHRHSMVSGSPLGPKASDMDAVRQKRFADLILERFMRAKEGPR